MSLKQLRASLLAALMIALLIPSFAFADVVSPDDDKEEEKEDDGGCAVSQSYTPPQSAAALALGALALVGAARRRQRA
jgi:MYXO-CTERM domain-containing protein